MIPCLQCRKQDWPGWFGAGSLYALGLSLPRPRIPRPNARSKPMAQSSWHQQHIGISLSAWWVLPSPQLRDQVPPSPVSREIPPSSMMTRDGRISTAAFPAIFFYRRRRRWWAGGLVGAVHLIFSPSSTCAQQRGTPARCDFLGPVCVDGFLLHDVHSRMVLIVIASQEQEETRKEKGKGRRRDGGSKVATIRWYFIYVFIRSIAVSACACCRFLMLVSSADCSRAAREERERGEHVEPKGWFWFLAWLKVCPSFLASSASGVFDELHINYEVLGEVISYLLHLPRIESKCMN